MGMNSRDDGEGLYKNGGRPMMNIALVLDISGSMQCPFNGEKESKLDVAKNVIVTGLLPHLKPDDSLCIILFDTDYKIYFPFKAVKDIDMSELKSSVLRISTGGGTTMRVGLEGATIALDGYTGKVNKTSRIFFLTDAIPNDSGDHPEMVEISKENIKNNIFTTFIGLGVDFNVEFINDIASIKGSNYYSIKSAVDFKKIMDTDFDYLTYVNALDIKVKYDGNDISIERIYGSPGNETPTAGIVCHVTSSFPSPKEDPNTTKGGVVLLKFKRNSQNTQIMFTSSYIDCEGKVYNDEHVIKLPPSPEENCFEGSAVRKAVLLTRYVNIMRQFIQEAKTTKSQNSEHIQSALKKFRSYYVKEADELHDSTLLKELKMLDQFINASVKPNN